MNYPEKNQLDVQVLESNTVPAEFHQEKEFQEENAGTKGSQLLRQSQSQSRK